MPHPVPRRSQDGRRRALRLRRLACGSSLPTNSPASSWSAGSSGLRRSLPHPLTAVFLVHEKHIRPWRERLEGIDVLELDEVIPVTVGKRERIACGASISSSTSGSASTHSRFDTASSRLSRGRWAAGTPTRFSTRTARDALCVAQHRECERCLAPLATAPRSEPTPPAHAEGLRRARPHESAGPGHDSRSSPRPDVCNSQTSDTSRAGTIPGKGRVAVPRLVHRPERDHARRPRPLARHRHGARTVTGWPQTDVYHRQRARRRIDTPRPSSASRPTARSSSTPGTCLTTCPYEGNPGARLVAWWRETGANSASRSSFAPPVRQAGNERFGAALDDPDAAVQRTRLTDLEDLAVLLQYVDCVSRMPARSSSKRSPTTARPCASRSTRALRRDAGGPT